MEQVNSKILLNLITTKDELRQLINDCLKNQLANKDSPQGTHSPNEELLTIQQLADFFQVSTTTIHNWKNEGVIPYVKVKSRIRFKKSVVLALDEKRRKKSKY